MKFSKQIVDEFASWIDLKDVQEYVKKHYELTKKDKNTKKLKIFTKYIIKKTKDISCKKQKIFRIIKILNSYPH